MRSSRGWKNGAGPRFCHRSLSLLAMFLRSPTPFCSLPSPWLASPFACTLRLPVSDPSFSRTLPAMSFIWPLAWSLFIKRSCHGRKCPPQPEQGSCLRRPGRPLGLAGDLHSRRVEVGPGRRALRPDVRGDPQGRRIVERAGPHADHLRQRLAVAIERRAAVGAEVAE